MFLKESLKKIKATGHRVQLPLDDMPIVDSAFLPTFLYTIVFYMCHTSKFQFFSILIKAANPCNPLLLHLKSSILVMLPNDLPIISLAVKFQLLIIN